ncbi:putative RNA-binding protein (virulence factor B family) [Catalinimonas alkaloidigena]|uniref:CvfB family protein n=1 Tax=Catalinimonas alkaloidigena TaxID=1075417 RepID=UPI002405524A|nr:S1-like domain-containing RNA-binding protein [Catalinimonas alkaloidigena]MDF9796999.1 putative RNA-binding protein (virulence factor B family) [Catalinimonas alkaloidigena]
MTNLKIGEYNELEVNRESPHGMYLQSSQGEILLPNRYVGELKPGDTVNVFVYTDSEDRLVAITEQPKATSGEFASLLVKDVTTVGAFLDWGINKDLLLPYREQLHPVKVGDQVIVRVITDPKTDRVIAISKIQAFIQRELDDLSEGQEVELMVYDQTPLGYKVLINRKNEGLLYNNELFQEVRLGEVMQGFVKKIREDEKVDVSLQQQGVRGMKNARTDLLEALQQAGGFLPIHDKSSPEEVQAAVQMSKKAFKKAAGNLFKEKKITFTESGIKLR